MECDFGRLMCNVKVVQDLIITCFLDASFLQESLGKSDPKNISVCLHLPHLGRTEIEEFFSIKVLWLRVWWPTSLKTIGPVFLPGGHWSLQMRISIWLLFGEYPREFLECSWYGLFCCWCFPFASLLLLCYSFARVSVFSVIVCSLVLFPGFQGYAHWSSHCGWFVAYWMNLAQKNNRWTVIYPV